MSKRKELGISTVGPSRPWSASGGHTTRLLRKPCSYAFSKYRFRPGWGGTCRETHERGTQRKRPEKDRQPARRRAALLDSSSTPRSGAPSSGAAERRQEHHALPVCVRGEELRNLVVEEGESGGAETKGVGGEVEAAADDSPLELGGPIAAIAEPGEDRLEIREAVDVRPGCRRKPLEEAESARDRTKLAFLEELERPLRAPEVVGTGRQTLHRVCDHVEVEQARLRVLREVRGNRGGRDGERSGKLLEGERARDVETTRRAPAENDALERLGRPVRLRERTKGKDVAQGIWFRTGKEHAAPACDLLPVLEAGRAVDCADCRVFDLSRRQRLGLEVQRGGIRHRRWRLGRSPEWNEGKGPLPSRVQSEEVLDVPIRETCDDLGCESPSGGHGKQVRVECSTVPEGMAVGSVSVFPGVAPVRGGARDDDRRLSQRRFTAGSLDERVAVVTDTQAPKREVVRAEVVDARRKMREVTAGEIEVDVVESARVGCRAEVEVAGRGALDLRDPGRVVEDAGELDVLVAHAATVLPAPRDGADGAR